MCVICDTYCMSYSLLIYVHILKPNILTQFQENKIKFYENKIEFQGSVIEFQGDKIEFREMKMNFREIK